MTESIEKLCGQLTLLEGEKTGISITEGDVEEVRAQGGRCLIGRIWSEKLVNKEAFKSVLSRVWQTIRGMIFRELNDNVWLFEFEDEVDMRRVLDGRPWSFDRQILVLNEFDGSIPPSQMKFTHSPFWVQVHDMPLLFMTKGIGEKIGESLGQLVEIDIAGDGVGWGRCLRIRVVLDLTKPLDRGRAITLAGKSHWVIFKYEKLPSMCFDCGRILHEETGCPIPRKTRWSSQGGTKQWGVWIRADDRRRKTVGGHSTFTGEDGWQRSPEGERSEGDGSKRKSQAEKETTGFYGNPSTGANRTQGVGVADSGSCHVGIQDGREEKEKESKGDSAEQILEVTAETINGMKGGETITGKKGYSEDPIIGDNLVEG